jgi:hypothetical protein
VGVEFEGVILCIHKYRVRPDFQKRCDLKPIFAKGFIASLRMDQTHRVIVRMQNMRFIHHDIVMQIQHTASGIPACLQRGGINDDSRFSFEISGEFFPGEFLPIDRCGHFQMKGNDIGVHFKHIFTPK